MLPLFSVGLNYSANDLGLCVDHNSDSLLPLYPAVKSLLLLALICYLTIFAFILSFLFLADIQYFEEAGKHFTYEALSHLGSATPMISGAFRLHPLLSTISLISCIATAILTWFLIKSLLTFCLSFRGARACLILFIPLWIGVLVVGIRGGISNGLPLSVGDSLNSTNPYINALCLNPVYSTLRTILASSTIPDHPSHEAEYIRMVKSLLDVPNPSMLSDYPLLRLSRGTPGGNRPLFFDLGADPNCNRDIWGEKAELGLSFQDQLKAYIVLSQKMLYRNRVYPLN